MKAFLILIFSACLLPATSQAVKSEPGTSRFLLRDAQFFTQPADDVPANEAFASIDFDKRFDFSKSISVQFHPYAYAVTGYKTRQSRAVIDPRALYAEYAKNKNWVRLGYQTLKWEGTDGLNPMDVASMKDWSDPLQTETRASGAVSVGRSSDSYDFEVSYIPWQTLWLLPGEKSAWLPRRFSFPLRTDALEVRLPSRIDYRFADPLVIDEARSSNVAGRLQVRGGWGDIALAFYDGLSDAPALAPTLDVVPIQVSPKPIYQLLSPAEITPIAYRVRTVAGFASHAFGQWIFRGATRYDQPVGNDRRIPSWSQYSVVGFERSFEFGDDTVTALVQAAFVRAPESATLLSIRDVFHQTILFGLRAPWGEKWLTTISGFKSTRDSSYYGKIEIGYRWSDHWRTDVAAEFLDGPPETLPGVFGANDRAFVTLTAVY